MFSSRPTESTAKSLEQYNVDLQRLYGFTDADVSANRQGYVSDGQRPGLEKWAKGARRSQGGIGYFIFIMVILFVPMLALNYFTNNALGNLLSTPSTAIVFVIAFGIVIVIAAGSQMVSRRTWGPVDSVEKMPILVAEGVLESDPNPFRSRRLYGDHLEPLVRTREFYAYRSAQYVMRIGDHRFILTEHVLPYFAEGGTYRLYFVEYVYFKLLLSAELLALP